MMGAMLKKIKSVFGWVRGVVKRMSWRARILLVVVVLALFMFVGIEVTGTPGFCNSCHIMNEYYDSWKVSSHNEVSCLKCHTEPGLLNYAKAKINGLAQTVDCLVGRVGTKANGFVPDASCLRSGCHDAEKVAAVKIDFKGIKFTHAKHISKSVDGIEITCGLCHSHFEGDEHFNVNTDVCFTCHFLKAKDTDKRLVQTDCRSCHEVPDKVIKRGMVEVNHAEFVSYQANCGDSCHKGQIEKDSTIDENVCLMCHSFSASHEEIDSVELHKLHGGGEKVECFACHGKVAHVRTAGASLSAMMDCTECHSDTHNIQSSFYGAEQHPTGKADDRILGPMYLTHVKCSDCHIGKVPINGDSSIVSIGTVAKALPAACDKCHPKGTGEKFIPFWQNQTKKLHALASGKLEKLREQIAVEDDKAKAKELSGAAKQVQTLLDTVTADGSWGVHNLKYTEALLLKANDIVNQSE